jgi:predicted metal-binding protein
VNNTKVLTSKEGKFTMQNQDVVWVCTLCGSTAQTRSQGIPSDGEKLLAQIQALRPPGSSNIAVQGVRCMAACKQSCAIALMGQGKRTYLFGNLPTEPENLAETAAILLNYAHQYHAHPLGSVPYSNCPELLRSRMLAVLPPLA